MDPFCTGFVENIFPNHSTLNSCSALGTGILCPKLIAGGLTFFAGGSAATRATRFHGHPLVVRDDLSNVRKFINNPPTSPCQPPPGTVTFVTTNKTLRVGSVVLHGIAAVGTCFLHGLAGHFVDLLSLL